MISGAALLFVGLVAGVLIGPHLPDRIGGPAPVAAVGTSLPGPAGPSATAPAAASAAGSAPAPTAPGRLVVALGDSITYNSDSWFRQLCAGRAVLSNCLNQGIRGNTTSQMLARLDVDVLARRPSAVIVMGGTNDLARANPRTADIVRRLVVVVQRCRGAGATVVLATIPPRDNFGPAVLELNRAIRAYAAHDRVPLLDLYPSIGDQAGRFRPGLTLDGVHPTAPGSDLMTAMARAQLPALLRQ